MSTFECPESVNVTSYGKAVYVFMQGDYVEVSEMDWLCWITRGPHVIKSMRGSLGQRRRDNGSRHWRGTVADGGRGQEPRNAGASSSWEKLETDSPSELPEAAGPADTVTSVQVSWFWTSGEEPFVRRYTGAVSGPESMLICCSIPRSWCGCCRRVVIRGTLTVAHSRGSRVQTWCVYAGFWPSRCLKVFSELFTTI